MKFIGFTGSTEVGKLLMRQAAATVKKVGLELGGNAPFIVFDDADLDAAVDGAIVSKYRNMGQTCVCANRIYVQDGIYDAFVEKFAKKVIDLKVGNGTEVGVMQGPLITMEAVEKVESHIADAVAKGGKVVVGGKRHALGRTFFEPTVIANVTTKMVVATDETFGPMAPIFRFTDEADVIAQANATQYGLASYFYARDLGRVFRVSEALEYGMVAVNTALLGAAEVPFGGVKESGLGREGSKHGMDEFVEIKYVLLAAWGCEGSGSVYTSVIWSYRQPVGPQCSRSATGASPDGQQLAKRRGVTMTEAVAGALEKELAAQDASLPLAQRLMEIGKASAAKAGAGGAPSRATTSTDVDALMFIDTSAFVAILAAEDDAGQFADAIQRAKRRVTAPHVRLEACMVLATRLDREPESVEADFDALLAAAGVEVLPFTDADAKLAVRAFAAYGKGRKKPGKLNLADCMSYAAAKSANAAILFKGRDFGETDLRIAACEGIVRLGAWLSLRIAPNARDATRVSGTAKGAPKAFSYETNLCTVTVNPRKAASAARAPGTHG